MLGLLDLVRIGARAVSRYTGMVLALWVTQALVTGAAIVGIAQTLAAALADRPLLDDAVDGDLVALLELMSALPELLWASIWTIVAIVLLWVVASWFLAGGVIAVLGERPEGRAATARCFGAGGANTFLAYVALGLYAWLGYMPAIIAFGMGADWAASRIEFALTLPEVALSLGLGLAPGLLLWVVAGTVVDFARVELAARRGSHELGALAAYARAWLFVLARPLALVHALLGWAFWIGITLLYLWLAHGRAMLGTGGALTLLMIRQGVSLARMVIKVGVVAGQVGLGDERMPPPRKPPRATA